MSVLDQSSQAGPRLRISLEDGGLGHTGRGCAGTSRNLTGKKWPRRLSWRKTGGHSAGLEKVAPPALPTPPKPSQPLGPTLRGVIGSGGRRRAGGDSRETVRLSVAICLSGRDRPGRCGPGSSRPRPPPQPDPGPRGSRARPLNGAGWRQDSGRRGSVREAGMGSKSESPRAPPPPPHTHTRTTRQEGDQTPSGTSTAGHTRRPHTSPELSPGTVISSALFSRQPPATSHDARPHSTTKPSTRAHANPRPVTQTKDTNEAQPGAGPISGP